MPWKIPRMHINECYFLFQKLPFHFPASILFLDHIKFSLFYFKYFDLNQCSWKMLPNGANNWRKNWAKMKSPRINEESNSKRCRKIKTLRRLGLQLLSIFFISPIFYEVSFLPSFVFPKLSINDHCYCCSYHHYSFTVFIFIYSFVGLDYFKWGEGNKKASRPIYHDRGPSAIKLGKENLTFYNLK